MKKKIFIAAAVLFSSSMYAQTDSAKNLNEVVVTATKSPTRQSQTGKVITVISKEQIERSSGKSLSQLLNEQVGLTINGAYNTAGTNQSVYMRGASTGRTLILLDGIPVYDPSMINNEFDLNLFSLNNVERIEVCRGAQSTLYGSDAIAGVINIITIKKEVKKPFNAKATLSAGSYSTFKTNLQLYGKVGRLTYTTRFGNLSTKGFSSAYDSIGGKDFDKDKYNGNVWNIALQYQATAALSFRSFFQQTRYKNSIDAGVFSDEKDYSIENKNKMGGAGFRFSKTNISLTGNYQYSDITRLYVNDSTDVPGFTKYSTDNNYGKNQFAELYTNIGLGSGFSLLQGADYRFSNMNEQYYSLSAFGPYSSFTKDSVQSQASLYASLFYAALKEKLNIELGGRLNVHSRYGSNYTYTFNPSFSINKNFRIFTSFATGFKAPSLYQLYSSYGKPDLQPERSKNFEIGIQQTHKKISSRIVYFYRDIKDGIDFDNSKFKYFNINRQKVNGLELEIAAEPVTNFSLSLNYTCLKPTENSQSRITFKDTTYDNLLRRPRHNLNITAAYQFKNGFYISASGKYVSKRLDVGGYKKADVELDSYFLLGMYASYSFKQHLKLFVDAQNIGNKKFFDVRGYSSIPFLLNSGVIFNW
ncbi:MAG: TonB-dependent receptor [Ferruginibacter sp.]